jgi:hypothetical protein
VAQKAPVYRRTSTCKKESTMRILTHVMHWQAIEVVIVAVNRGEVKTIALETGPNVAPGQYSGLLGATSEVNEGNWLTVAPGGQAMLHLGQLSTFVVRSQPPHP